MRFIITDTKKKDLTGCMLTTLSFGVSYVCAAVLDFTIVQPENYARMKYRNFYAQNFTVGLLLGLSSYSLFALTTSLAENYFNRPTQNRDYHLALLSLPLVLMPTLNQLATLIDQENRMHCLTGYVEVEALLWSLISSYVLLSLCIQKSHSGSFQPEPTTPTSNNINYKLFFNDTKPSAPLLDNTPFNFRRSYTQPKRKKKSPLDSDFFHNQFHSITPKKQLAWLKDTFHLDEDTLDQYIPSDFYCMIIPEVMSDPVELPTTHGDAVVVERAHIEQSLKRKRENPYTRERLTPDQLIPREDLKNTIRLFMISLADELDTQPDAVSALKVTAEQFSNTAIDRGLHWV